MAASGPSSLASRLFLTTTLIVGVVLRIIGFTRGTNEDGFQADLDSFDRFHPDEELVVGGALSPFDWLNPPFTVYGILPTHLLRFCLYVFGWAFEWPALSLADPESARRAYFVARGLAIVFSCASMGVVWLIAKRHMGDLQASLALAIIAYSPGAVQQAHFFIVDCLFLLVATATLGAIVEAAKSHRWGWFVLCGLLVGITAAVRLNGVVLGLILAIHSLLDTGGANRSGASGLRCLLLTGIVAVSTLVVLQPNLLVQPADLFLANATKDFGHAIQIARGELLQPWTLVDYHTQPFVYHWTHLLPLAVGSVVTVFGVIAVLYALRTRGVAQVTLLLWVVLYFLLVGGLLAKSVRYVVPLVPAIAILCADLAARILSQKRLLGTTLIAVLLCPSFIYGLAFGHIYTEPDSRLRAARWLQQRVSKGSSVGLEKGGFPLYRILDGSHIKKVWLDLPQIFYTSPYLLCTTRLDLLRERLEAMDLLAIVTANRMAQYSAVPDLFPVVAGFYRRLANQEAGFLLEQRFKTNPTLFGIEFDDSASEPSFTGYDHPEVQIYSIDREAMYTAFHAWRLQLQTDDDCADRRLTAAATAIQRKDYERAQQQLAKAVANFPRMKTTYLLSSEIHLQQKNQSLSAVAKQKYRPESGVGGTLHASNYGTIHLIPGFSALTLVELGLYDLALRTLNEGVGESYRYTKDAESMAESYSIVAKRFFELRRLTEMRKTLDFSLQIYPIPAALNVLGTFAYGEGQTAVALDHWKRSLVIDDAQPNVHMLVAKANLDKLLDPAIARHHWQRAIILDPSLTSQLEPWIAKTRTWTNRE